MNIDHLKLLLAQGESNTLEFKTSTAQLKSAFETVCAFLNNKGGIVLIGVNDKGQLIGQDVSDNTRREIGREINKIEPMALIDVHYLEVKENKFVIAIHANAGDHAPYIYDGRAFQRDESNTNRMLQHRYEQLLVKRGQLNHSWEDVIASEYSIADLNHEEIYKTVSDGIRENRIPASAQRDDVRQILERLNLIVGEQLKRAAIVLYAKQESIKFVQSMIKMARFKGTDKLGDFIDNQQIVGNSFSLLSEADAFLRRHLPIASFFKPDQFKRIDKPALPVMAVREALINAICHRDYADRYTDISLAIYDDRLEIWNSGLLLKKLTLEDLKQAHESVLRNKFIANTFYIRGLIEKWGSGTNKMIDLCRQEGIPEPEFVERTGGLAVIFKFKEPIGGYEIAEPIGGYKIVKLLELTPRQREILEILEKLQLNSAQITVKLKNSSSRRAVQVDLTKLEKAGLIRREGESRSIVWRLVK